MKYNIDMKKYIQYLSLALAISGMVSCLPQDVIFEDDGANGIVEIYNFNSARSASQTYASRDINALLAYPGEYDFEINATSFDFPIVVNYTGNHGAPKDVTVELAVDEAIADVVGRQTGLDYAVLPASAYTLPGNSVTIAGGANRAEYRVQVNASVLTAGKVYVLGIKITGASGGTVSGNFAAGGFYFKAL
ncbi:MAG: DUF1735 domain-containing protein [Tannerella sp.]|jgi:hypothetical protein|nr:DUF1735 domain-containing protein [Tannerella sp.]